MSDPTSSDVHVGGTSWRYRKPRELKRVRRVRKDVDSLTNSVADARFPLYRQKLQEALKDLRAGLTDEAADIADLGHIDARTIEGLDSFKEFVEQLTTDSEQELRATLLVAGGAASRAAELSGFEFDYTSPTAEAWAKDRAAELVTSISERTRDGIQAIIGDAFESQVDVPDTKREVAERLARDLGNFGGLTERDFGAVINYRDRLVEDGVDLDQADVRAGRAGERYLKDRAETIARTEILTASNRGQQEFWRQASDAGLIDEGKTRQEWILTEDSITCPICEELVVMDENQNVGLGEKFMTPDGDEIDGPPAHPRCRCTVSLVIERPDSSERAAVQATGEDGADDPLGAAIDEAESEVKKMSLKGILGRAFGVGTLYVHRPLLNAVDLEAWAVRAGLGKLDPDPHVTIAYSKKSLAWPAPLVDTIGIVNKEWRAVKRLGDEGAIVLTFYSSDLGHRWEQLLGLGAAWEHDQYIPHVTINYGPTTLDLERIEPYTGPLMFGPEVFDVVKEDR